MCSHGHNLGNDSLVCPFDAKHLGELLQVVRSGFSDREDGVTQPGHAQRGELFIEEFDTQLASKEWDILNDGQSDAPLLILSELYNSWEEGLREEVDANDLVDKFELGDDVEADVGEFVFEHLEEHGKKVVDSLLFAKYRSKAADLRAKGSTDMLRAVGDQVLDRSHNIIKQGGPV